MCECVKNTPAYPSPPSPFTPSLQRLRLLERFLYAANHVERLLGQAVALAVYDHPETLDGLLERNELSRRACEHFRDVERLRQEALYLARTRYRQLVLGGKFIHAQNRDDVAQLLVALQRRLYRTRGVVVVLADNVRVDLTRSRIQRVHCRINAERGDVAG